MKTETPQTDNVNSLVDLYIKMRNELLSNLEGLPPNEASTKISHFVRELERPYTDHSELNEQQTRIAHYSLSIAAEASKIIVAVTANPNLTEIAETVQSKPSETAQLLSNTVKSAIRLADDVIGPLGRIQRLFTQKIKSAVGSVRRIAGFFLLAIVAISITSVAAIFYVPSALVPIIALIVIAVIATAGATSTFVSKPPIASFSLPELQPAASIPSVEDIKIEYAFDIDIIDKKIRNSLRIADELLGFFASKSASREENDFTFNTDRTLELLQSLVSHCIVSIPEKSIDVLANEAIHLLRTMHITLAEYTDEQADFFEKRPAGIAERRTLLPALINDKGEVVCQGVVLVPVR